MYIFPIYVFLLKDFNRGLEDKIKLFTKSLLSCNLSRMSQICKGPEKINWKLQNILSRKDLCVLQISCLMGSNWKYGEEKRVACYFSLLPREQIHLVIWKAWVLPFAWFYLVFIWEYRDWGKSALQSICSQPRWIWPSPVSVLMAEREKLVLH